MRTIAVYWILGLFSLSSLAGCGLFRNSCTERNSGQRLPQCVRTPCSACPTTPSYCVYKTACGRLGWAWWEIGDPVAREPQPYRNLALLYQELAAKKLEILPMSSVPQAVVRTVEPPIASDEEQEPAGERLQILRMSPPEVAVQGVEPPVASEEKQATFPTIVGHVHQYRKTWRLRYAAVDQEDRYGGVVILEGSADLSKLRDGQHVRVRGVLQEPDSRLGSAHYRVQSIEVLD